MQRRDTPTTAGTARLEIVTGSRAGQSVTLCAGSYILGSDEAATITFLDPEVEWSHARIYESKGRFWVEDLQSRGGVKVNDRRVLHKALSDGDRISIGQTELLFTRKSSVTEASGNADKRGARERKEKASRTAPTGQEAKPSGVAVHSNTPRSGAHVQTAPPGAGPMLGAALADVIEAVQRAQSAPDGADSAALRRSAAQTAESEGSAQDAMQGTAAPDRSGASIESEQLTARAGTGEDEREQPSETGDGRHETQDGAESDVGPAPAASAPSARLEAEEGERSALLDSSAGPLSEATEEDEDVEQGQAIPDEARTALVEQLEAEIDRLRAQLEKEQEENVDLKAWIATLEQELAKKRDGLSLATESFVAQLQRAKERIHEFAKRHAETEQALRQRDEEIARLREEKQAIEVQAEQRVRRLIDRLEAVRRDFEEMDRLLRTKAKSYARSLSEARAERNSALVLVQPSPDGQETDSAIQSGVNSGVSPTALRSGVTNGRASASGSGAVVEKEAANGRASAPVAAASYPGDEIVAAGGWRRYRERALQVAFGIVLLVCLYLLWQLVTEPSDRGVVANTKVAQVPASPQPPRRTFSLSQLTRANKKPESPEGISASSRTEKRSASSGNEAQAPGSNGDSSTTLLEGLKRAHRMRDQDAIAREEQALIARGQEIIEVLKEAYENEQSFGVKVSLVYVVLAITGKASPGVILEGIHRTKDSNEILQLLFVLQKLQRPEDVAEMERLVRTEQDSRVKKYLIRALGNAPGNGGLAALEDIARNDTDYNARNEAIRALEKKRDAKTVQVLLDIAEREQNASVRSTAIRSLAAVGGREVVEFFKDVLERDTRLNNRAEAAKFMARVGDASDLPVLEALYQREQHHYIRNKLKQAIEAIRRRSRD